MKTRSHVPLKIKNAHERDEHIVFDEEPHVYYVRGDPDNISVTTMIHKNFPHFNANRMAPLCSKKGFNDPDSKYYQMTPEDIKQSWQDNCNQACFDGTRMHKAIELFYNEEAIDEDVLASTEYKYFERFHADIPELHGRLKPYRTEWEVYDEDLKLAGSIDMIFEKEDGSLLIYDWKRSKEIKTEAYGNDKGFPPFEHLPNCNFWHYSLQLNTYKRILETKYGKKIDGLFLVVLHPNNPNGSYMRYECADLTSEVDTLFEARRSAITRC